MLRSACLFEQDNIQWWSIHLGRPILAQITVLAWARSVAQDRLSSTGRRSNTTKASSHGFVMDMSGFLVPFWTNPGHSWGPSIWKFVARPKAA